MNELVINKDNFYEYFRDVKNNKPQRDEVIARFTAIAEFMDGQMKRDVIDLLSNNGKTEAAIRVMQNIGSATEKEAIRICKEICKDLSEGMSFQEVENKTYEYQLEFFYYTKKENIPIDDPHWSIISIKNLDEFLDKSGQKIKMNVKLLPSVEQENDSNEV